MFFPVLWRPGIPEGPLPTPAPCQDAPTLLSDWAGGLYFFPYVLGILKQSCLFLIFPSETSLCLPLTWGGPFVMLRLLYPSLSLVYDPPSVLIQFISPCEGGCTADLLQRFSPPLFTLHQSQLFLWFHPLNMVWTPPIAARAPLQKGFFTILFYSTTTLFSYYYYHYFTYLFIWTNFLMQSS